MGLDDFTDDSSSSNSSSSNTSSSNKEYKSSKPNKPSYATQRFSDTPDTYPRAIRYQIKSIGRHWSRTYSTRRFDSGEEVLYGAGKRAKEDGCAVIAFTTIQSVVDELDDTETKDIYVVCYNIEENDRITEGEKIEYGDRWTQELYDAVRSEMNNLKDHLD